MPLSLRYKLSLYIQLLGHSGSIFDSIMFLSKRPSGVNISCIFFSTNFLQIVMSYSKIRMMSIQISYEISRLHGASKGEDFSWPVSLKKEF